MKRFLKSYFDQHGTISSRRVNAFIGLIGLIVFSVWRIFATFPVEILYIFAGLAVGTSLSLIGQERHYNDEDMSA